MISGEEKSLPIRLRVGEGFREGENERRRTTDIRNHVSQFRSRNQYHGVKLMKRTLAITLILALLLALVATAA